MQSKLTSSEGNRQTGAETFLTNFPNLSCKTSRQLAAMMQDARRKSDGILITHILDELVKRESMLPVSHILERFIKNCWEL